MIIVILFVSLVAATLLAGAVCMASRAEGPLDVPRSHRHQPIIINDLARTGALWFPPQPKP